MSHSESGGGRLRRVRATYAGRVQGVGFRATVRTIAREHPVTGWVRNDPDGGVTLEAQGAATDLESFLADVRGRTPGHIAREDVRDIPPVADERSFDIRR
jgi:acylphosphatase